MTSRELKHLRHTLGLTQADVAAELNLSTNTIRRYEANTSMPLTVDLALRVVTGTLGLDISSLAPTKNLWTAEAICTLREAMALTQVGFAGIFGLGATAVSAWERGRSAPNLRQQRQLDTLKARISNRDSPPDQPGGN